jgi:hypothetical protein
MMTHMGDHPPLDDDDYRAVAAPVRLVVGDRDAMAGMEDTAAVYRLLPAGELAVLPATPHPLERVSLESLAGLAEEFFTGGWLA